jgi:hypothetical protein
VILIAEIHTTLRNLWRWSVLIEIKMRFLYYLIRMDTIERFAKGRIPSLNGWRAVAILLVLLDHSVYTVGPRTFFRPQWGHVWLGHKAGVSSTRITTFRSFSW